MLVYQLACMGFSAFRKQRCIAKPEQNKKFQYMLYMTLAMHSIRASLS